MTYEQFIELRAALTAIWSETPVAALLYGIAVVKPSSLLVWQRISDDLRS